MTLQVELRATLLRLFPLLHFVSIFISIAAKDHLPWRMDGNEDPQEPFALMIP